MIYYKLRINETGRYNLREEAHHFNSITEYFENKLEMKEFLIKRYGKIPEQKNKIFVDDGNGNSEVVGFIYSFWNRDISHNSKSWYQTDWVECYSVEEIPICIKGD